MEQNKALYPNCSPTPLRITTHTAKCKINSCVDLEKLAKNLEPDTYIKYIEYKKNDISYIKGFNHNNSAKKNNKKGKFYNQVTIIVEPELGFRNNIKIFNNGSVSMTGIKKIENGKRSINIILERIKSINDTILETNGCKITDFSIALINSDYEISYDIKRTELHKLLINTYKIFSSYEPCIYPGVNSKYYWNTDYMNKEYKGRCYCTVQCNGKGTGTGNGQCKKITISAFQSGSIIITGARALEQIYSAYNFINSIFDKHYELITQKQAPFLDVDDAYNTSKIYKKVKNKNIIYIKKDNIINREQIPNLS